MQKTIEMIIIRSFNEEEQKKLSDEIKTNDFDTSFLTPREEKILELREEGKTLEQCGKELGVTRERIRQIEKKGEYRIIRRLKSLLEEIKQKEWEEEHQKETEAYLIAELKRRIPYLKSLITYINGLQALVPEKELNNIYDTPIGDLDFSFRTYNALVRYFCNYKDKRGDEITLGDIAQLSIEELIKVKNLGRKSLKEIKYKLAEYNIYLKEYSE